MAEEVGTIINAEIEGVKIVLKGGAESVKALLKLFAVLFGKEAAERRRAKAQAKMTEAELKELNDKKHIAERLKRDPCSASTSDIQHTSEGVIQVIHLPKQYSKSGSAIGLVCRDKGIEIPDTILNNPIIEDRNRQIFKWLEDNPAELAKLTDKDLAVTKLDYLRIKNGLPLVKNPVDDNPNDDFDCFMSRGQDLAFWADTEKSALKEYKSSKEEQALQYENIAKQEDDLSQKATETEPKKRHKKNADEARAAKSECEEDIKVADEIEKAGPVPLDQFAMKETVRESLKDVNAEKLRTGQHWEEKIDEAFNPVYSEEKIPESGKRFYSGKNGSYAVRDYIVEPPKIVTVLNDDGTERQKIEPAKVNSVYSVYDKNGKNIASFDERFCTPKQWKDEAIPELQKTLGLESAAVVTIGETKDAIFPVDVERATAPLSEDAKTFNKEAAKEEKKTENFNRAATYENIKNVGGDEKTAYFEAELSNGNKAVISVPNDKDHISKGENGLYNVTLGKNDTYAVLQKGEKDAKGYKLTGKSVSHADISKLGSGNTPKKAPTMPKKAPTTATRK